MAAGPNKGRLVSELTGLGAGGGALEKLTISYEDGLTGRKQAVVALFNPNEISISRSISYEEKRVASKAESGVPDQLLRAIEPATLAVDLLFDTYEDRTSVADWKRAAAQAGGPDDVTKRTDEIVKLAQPDIHTHRPPVCALTWGRFAIFTGVLTSLAERFTMFLPSGIPVRATLSCSFVEVGKEATRREGELQSADVHKSRVVRRHDTVQSIAAEEYDDPGLWRAIARANGLVDPRAIEPGMTLVIPRLQP
jgi:nucleoid-associated protein YgaU